MRPPALRIFDDELIVDNFAGGGGASLGIEWALGRSPDIAINHDAEAIAMHSVNHPETRHYCEDVWKVDPAEACRGRPVGLAWFSPDCKHFSKAKGRKPVDKRIRGLAWVVVRWAKAVRPRVIMLENVEEFEAWGPLLEDGLPCPVRKGFTFRRWWKMLENLGYHIEARQLVAADYGAATTRNRLFIVARRDGLPIIWPEKSDAFRVEGRRTAADCIIWQLPTYSIFLTKDEGRRYGVKRPLAENTERRIARGLQKFVIDDPEPFIVPITHAGDARVHPVSDPLRTITSAKRGEFSLIAPYMVPRYGERAGQEPRALSVERPMPTIVPTKNGGQLVAAFLAKHYGGHETPGQALPRSLDTITARDHNALVASSIVKLKGTSQHGQQLDLPLHTIQASGNHYAEVRAFLLGYYSGERSGGQGSRCNAPAPTLSTHDRLGLVTVQGEPYVVADIGMRMLHPRELFRAQGFHDGYVIDLEIDGKPITKEAQVRMVGNSVCPPIAAALARAQFEEQVIEVLA